MKNYNENSYEDMSDEELLDIFYYSRKEDVRDEILRRMGYRIECR